MKFVRCDECKSVMFKKAIYTGYTEYYCFKCKKVKRVPPFYEGETE